MTVAPLARLIDLYTVEYVRTYPHPISRGTRAVSKATALGREPSLT